MPTFKGQHFDGLSMDKMTPGEIDAVERASGLTLQKIRRMGDTCVCEHGSKAHMHKADDGSVDEADTSCTSCDCPEHEADLPTRVMTALTWVAIRRSQPTVKYADVADAPLDELVASDEAPDPTDAPQPAESPA